MSQLNRDEKYITIEYGCEDCEEKNTSVVQITFTSENGNRFDFTADENGKVDYSEVTAGQYEVEMFDENGDTIMWYELTIEGEQAPDTPVEPDEPTEQPVPDEPDEPTPDEPTQPTEPDKPTDTDKPSDSVQDTEPENKGGNAGLVVGTIITLIALAGGATAVIIIIKKKNKKK